MTAVMDAPVDEIVETEAEKKARKPRTRDFNKYSEQHQELAEFVNARSGLDPITPNQVKALLSLKVDFANQPDQVAEREARAAEKKAELAKYAGLSDEQIKVRKSAEKEAAQAAKWAQRAAEAEAKAKALQEASAATGEDLAAAVEAAQHVSVETKRKPIRRPVK